MRSLTRTNRVMGLLDSTFLVIGSVLGSGIFLTSGLIVDRLPYPGFLWAAWIAGGLITLSGAMCYAELGAMYPSAGGPYVYLREAYGKVPAFIFGWTYFWIIGGCGIAAMAAGFSEYLSSIVPGISSGVSWLRLSWFGGRLVVTPAHLAAIAAVIFLTMFNGLPLRRSVRGQSWLTIIRLAALAILIGGGISFGIRTQAIHLHPFLPPAGTAWPAWPAWGAAVMTVLWAYDGWYAVNCTAEEVRDPGRNIPGALGLGTAAVLFLYLAVNIVYSMALPMERMRGIVRIGETAAAGLWGPSIGPVFGVVVALTIFGCLSANIFFSARVPYALARDGLFFRSLGGLHPRTGIPRRALAAQAVVSSALILTGTFQSLVEVVLFGLVFFFAATGAAVIVLRRKAPAIQRPFRVRPYPLLPLLFVAVNSGILSALAIEQPRRALLSAALILSGLPAFWIWNRQRVMSDRPNAAPPGAE
jgi:APA family basic amino acid/polyamine antiporter